MKRIFLSLLFLSLISVHLHAQSSTLETAEAPASGTIINSDEMHMDQTTHTAIFSGNVIVVGTSFRMRADDMTVTFGQDNHVDHILARGNVVIEEPDRTARCGQAEYFQDEDKYVLTEEPSILDNNKNEISAPKIIIYDKKKSLYTEGRTVTKLSQSVNSPTPAPSTQ